MWLKKKLEFFKILYILDVLLIQTGLLSSLHGLDFTTLVGKMKRSFSVDEAEDRNDLGNRAEPGVWLPSVLTAPEEACWEMAPMSPSPAHLASSWQAHLTLLSTVLSLAGGLVTGRLVLTTFTGCCSFPALLYLLLSNLGFGTPYFLRICGAERGRGPQLTPRCT